MHKSGCIFVIYAPGNGVPMRTDQANFSGDFGHYARVLIVVNLAAKFMLSLILDRECSCAQISLDYRMCLCFVHLVSLLVMILRIVTCLNRKMLNRVLRRWIR